MSHDQNGNIMSRINQIQEKRQLGKKKILKIVYERVRNKILEYENLRATMCIFHIPDQLPDCPVTDIIEVSNWLISVLKKEGFTAMSMNGIELDIGESHLGRIGTKNDILIIWYKKEINIYNDSKVNLKGIYEDSGSFDF